VSFTVVTTDRLTPMVHIARHDTAESALAQARREHAVTGSAVRVLADGEELLAIAESADEDDMLEADPSWAAWWTARTELAADALHEAA
jgi:hypothetical protein